MAEPRARMRNKGQGVFNDSDLKTLLHAYGNPGPSSTKEPPTFLPTTLSVLDEILTDFIIETCHAAALCASYSRRQKLKLDDFRFVLRRNPALLGRVQETLGKQEWMKEKRRIGVIDETVGKEGLGELEELAEVSGEVKGKKGKRGRKRKADGLDGGGGAKRLAA